MNIITHRCPAYQLHLPLKTRFGDPKKLSPGKCRKIPGNSGLPIKEYGNAKKKADPGNSGKFILGIPWRMRMAKVDMLGTEDKLHNWQITSKTMMLCNPMSTWYALQQRRKAHNRGNNSNQFCNVTKYYILREINSRTIKLCNVIILAPMVDGQCKYLVSSIVSVLKPLTCGRQSGCLGWIYNWLV